MDSAGIGLIIGRYKLINMIGGELKIANVNTQIQKIFEILERIILASTNENDLILDPFCGSSTTGIAANKLNRKYIGIDNSKEYLDLSIRRYKEIKE